MNKPITIEGAGMGQTILERASAPDTQATARASKGR